MAVRTTYVMQQTVKAIAATESAVLHFLFPRKHRVLKAWLISSVAQVAHATQVLDASFKNEGAAGAGTEIIALITNDSDDTSEPDPAVLTQAHVANVPSQIDFESRPGSPTWAQNEAKEVNAGDVIAVTVAAATGAATGDVTVGMEVIESD